MLKEEMMHKAYLIGLFCHMHVPWDQEQSSLGLVKITKTYFAHFWHKHQRTHWDWNPPWCKKKLSQARMAFGRICTHCLSFYINIHELPPGKLVKMSNKTPSSQAMLKKGDPGCCPDPSPNSTGSFLAHFPSCRKVSRKYRQSLFRNPANKQT